MNVYEQIIGGDCLGEILLINTFHEVSGFHEKYQSPKRLFACGCKWLKYSRMLEKKCLKFYIRVVISIQNLIVVIMTGKLDYIRRVLYGRRTFRWKKPPFKLDSWTSSPLSGSFRCFVPVNRLLLLSLLQLLPVSVPGFFDLELIFAIISPKLGWASLPASFRLSLSLLSSLLFLLFLFLSFGLDNGFPLPAPRP